jgi:GTPase Era involved in 16S rRNA processing
VLGNVSAGKSTVLNALLREKYSEVSMKRTTAGINYFRIFPKTQAGTSADSSGWTSVADNPRTADSTLKEITEDNAALRTRSSVQEKTFNIEVDKELVKMRKDTKLVLVDVPGINEAASSKKYKDYVASTWDSLDCVICVMDGRQGVNTEEALDLLKFVKTNLKEKKNLPVVILCNKVDDPDDDETAELVSEARAEVEKLFGVSDRKKALRTLLNSELSPSLVPVFLPISAVNAFIHQSGSHMTLQQFQKLDKYLIEK